MSPIGLVIDPTLNEDGNTGIGWILNIGGSSIDNFKTGIQIPVYVIVFGIVGGYLRYLYKTSKLRVSRVASSEAYVFSWENVPGSETDKLKDFLRNELNLDWTELQDFVKEGNTLKITDGTHLISIVLNEKQAHIINGNKKLISTFFVSKGKSTKLYQTVTSQKWLFYQSLEDLSLLFLAPLLSIAVWFLLTQSGMTSKYIIAVSSFAVGLVTEEIVRALIRFAKSPFQEAQEEAQDINKEIGSSSTVKSKETSVD